MSYIKLQEDAENYNRKIMVVVSVGNKYCYIHGYTFFIWNNLNFNPA